MVGLEMPIGRLHSLIKTRMQYINQREMRGRHEQKQYRHIHAEVVDTAKG